MNKKKSQSVRVKRLSLPLVPVEPHADIGMRGILSADIVRAEGGVKAVVIKIAPHYLVVVTGGEKPTVGLSCTHHGFVAEAFELNGQLEKVIQCVAKKFPELRCD